MIVPGMNMVHERVSIRPRNVSLPPPRLLPPRRLGARLGAELSCWGRGGGTWRESPSSRWRSRETRDPTPGGGAAPARGRA